jgi:hypothetical protein
MNSAYSSSSAQKGLRKTTGTSTSSKPFSSSSLSTTKSKVSSPFGDVALKKPLSDLKKKPSTTGASAAGPKKKAAGGVYPPPPPPPSRPSSSATAGTSNYSIGGSKYQGFVIKKEESKPNKIKMLLSASPAVVAEEKKSTPSSSAGSRKQGLKSTGGTFGNHGGSGTSSSTIRATATAPSGSIHKKNSTSSISSGKKPASVFSAKESSSSSIIVTSEMKDYVQRLKAVGAISNVEATPRDNDLVAAMLKVASNDPSVGQIHVQDDPRFAHISSSALLDFADGIRTNFYLTHLVMNHVDLGNGFLSALAEAMQDNLTVEYIDLRYNCFTSDALVDFCLAMKKNKGLVYVDLRNQNAPINSQQEKAVLEALVANNYVQKFYVEFRTGDKCQTFLDNVLDRNSQKKKTVKDKEKRIVEFLQKETVQKEKEYEQQKNAELQEASNTLTDKDCDYFYELANLAKQYKVDLTAPEDLTSSSSSPSRTPSSSGTVKDIEFPAKKMTADGSFLTDDFISMYFDEDKEMKTLTFEFTNQFKVFQRFSSDDPARKLIVEKFVEALVTHPRANDINILNLANTCIADDFLKKFSERCLAENRLKNLHQMNLETNFISGAGFVALADCIANPNIWRYLNTVKVDNQKAPCKTEAEVALAAALCVNRTIIRLSIRVRNLLERTRIAKAVQRNMDYLRQARQMYMKKTGTLKARARNKMEQMIDKIAANDPEIAGEVSIVGDQLFLGLNEAERIKSAACFKNNTHVRSVKMCMLKLDDAWCVAFGESLESNSTITNVVLENNAIGSEGISRIVGALGKNSTIQELQLRFQSKNMSTAEEDKLSTLMKDNTSVVKMGVELRSTLAKSELDRKLRSNQDLARKLRSSSVHSHSALGCSTHSAASMCSMSSQTSRYGANRVSSGASVCSTSSMIKSDATATLIQNIIDLNPRVTEVVLNKDDEFIEMPYSRKKEFLDGLMKNPKVTKVVLDNLELDNTFAEDLAHCIKCNLTIESLQINGNEFTSPGVLAIAKAAMRSKSLKTFTLLKPRFKITNEDAENLIKTAEKKATKLQKVEMEFREKSLEERLEKICRKNRGSRI